MTGKVFGRLTVLKETDERSNGGAIKYLCRCECGNLKIISGTALRSGVTISCGCYNHDVITKFGKSVYKEKLYSVWNGIKNRCRNPNDRAYKNYGGRGITICRQWEKDYQIFREWAFENGYKNGMWIDRIDNDGPYSPENCRWSTSKEQSKNKRTSVFVMYKGKRMNLADAAEQSGIKWSTLRRRINLGWDESRLFDRVDKKRSHGDAIKAYYNRSRTEVTITSLEDGI